MAKPLLTVEEIYQAALDLLDREGAEGLNARNLAAALKCSTRTLYQQVGKRDEMIGKLIEHYFSNLKMEFVEGENWQESATNWALTLRGALLAHPNLFSLMGTEHRAPIVQYVNPLLRTLLRAGFDEELALGACRVLVNIAINFSLSETTVPKPLRRSRRSVEEIRFEDLVIARTGGSRDQFQNPPEVFANAIRWTISGIEKDLQR